MESIKYHIIQYKNFNFLGFFQNPIRKTQFSYIIIGIFSKSYIYKFLPLYIKKHTGTHPRAQCLEKAHQIKTNINFVFSSRRKSCVHARVVQGSMKRNAQAISCFIDFVRPRCRALNYIPLFVDS